MNRKMFRIFCSIFIIMVIPVLIGCSDDNTETNLKSPDVFYYGTIVHIAELENGYLVYAYCPLHTGTDKLVNLWVTEQSVVDPTLMTMLEDGEPGGKFYAGIYNLGTDVVDNLFLKQVVCMDAVDELPAS